MMKRSLPFLFPALLGLLNACGGGGGTTTTPPPAPATHFSVSGPANIPSAISFKFTVTALDASNHPVTNYSATVHFTSTDPHSQLPPDATLVSGTNVFSGALTTSGD